MFNIGEVIRFKGREDMSAQNGALAKVVSMYSNGYYVIVEWSKDTENLRQGQMDGTYRAEDFYFEKDLELSF
jgi:hypothetical protein